MTLRDWLFGTCRACEARDRTIAILREELRNKDLVIESLKDNIDQNSISQSELISYLTGKSRITSTAQPGEMHSIRKSSGIQDRIRRAEAIDREQAGPINDQRKREFEARIAALEKPELVVIENEKEEINPAAS